MKLGWSASQVLALGLLAVMFFAISGFLELLTVTRLTVDRAATEGDLITKALHFQINDAVVASHGHPYEALLDPRIGSVLTAGTAQAPSVVFVAVCDSTGKVVAHTTPERVGTQIDSLAAFPRDLNWFGMARLVADLVRTPRVYEISTPLVLSGRPFATIHVGIAGLFVRERISEFSRRHATVAGVVIPLALIMGFTLARVATSRLRTFGAGVTALREGRFDNPFPHSGIDEFDRLAQDLNLLSQQFQKERLDRDTRFQQTVELLGDGILTLGPEREILLMNGATGRILGLSPTESRGQELEDLLPADHPVRQLAERVLAGDEKSLSVHVPASAGHSACVAVAHRISGGEESGGLLIEFKEKSALEGFHSMVDHSRVLSRLGQMSAGVAHQIRSSLQRISFELAALREVQTANPERVAGHVREASAAIRGLQLTVDGFLRIARLRQLAPEPLNVNDLLEDIAQKQDAEAELSGLDLELDLSPDLPETYADGEVLRQAVSNLVHNAVQALPSRDGSVLLSSRVVGEDITISVSDTGPGIPESIRDKIFDLYFTTKEGGTGVGLALVRQAIEMHGGDLSIESEPGRGTRMTLRLPARSPLPATS